MNFFWSTRLEVLEWMHYASMLLLKPFYVYCIVCAKPRGEFPLPAVLQCVGVFRMLTTPRAKLRSRGPSDLLALVGFPLPLQRKERHVSTQQLLRVWGESCLLNFSLRSIR